MSADTRRLVKFEHIGIPRYLDSNRDEFRDTVDQEDS
jgi:hypothetical protein